MRLTNRAVRWIWCFVLLPALGLLFIGAVEPPNGSIVLVIATIVVVAGLSALTAYRSDVGTGGAVLYFFTTATMIFALFGYWAIGLGVGILLAFSMEWRGIGIWVGLAAGLGVVAVLMLWRWTQRGRLLGRLQVMSVN